MYLSTGFLLHCKFTLQIPFYNCSWLLATYFWHCLFSYLVSFHLHFAAFHPPSPHFFGNLQSSHLSKMVSPPNSIVPFGNLENIFGDDIIQTVHPFRFGNMTKDVLVQPLDLGRNISKMVVCTYSSCQITQLSCTRGTHAPLQRAVRVHAQAGLRLQPGNNDCFHFCRYKARGYNGRWSRGHRRRLVKGLWKRSSI